MTTRRAWGTGRIYKRDRSPFWFIRWRDANAKRRTLSTRTTSYVDAERLLRAQLDLKERGANPDARKVTFAELVTLLLDDRRVREMGSEVKIKRLRAEFGQARAVNITSADASTQARRARR